MIDLEEYNQVKEFCGFDHEHRQDEQSLGVAYKHKKRMGLYCFMYIDFNRGRGEIKQCIRNKCGWYCFKNKTQTKLTDFGV